MPVSADDLYRLELFGAVLGRLRPNGAVWDCLLWVWGCLGLSGAILG